MTLFMDALGSNPMLTAQRHYDAADRAMIVAFVTRDQRRSHAPPPDHHPALRRLPNVSALRRRRSLHRILADPSRPRAGPVRRALTLITGTIITGGRRIHRSTKTQPNFCLNASASASCQKVTMAQESSSAVPQTGPQVAQTFTGIRQFSITHANTAASSTRNAR